LVALGDWGWSVPSASSARALGSVSGRTWRSTSSPPQPYHTDDRPRDEQNNRDTGHTHAPTLALDLQVCKVPSRVDRQDRLHQEKHPGPSCLLESWSQRQSIAYTRARPLAMSGAPRRGVSTAGVGRLVWGLVGVRDWDRNVQPADTAYTYSEM